MSPRHDHAVLYAFDTDAVLALINHDPGLARLVFDASMHDARIVVPIACVLEAAAACDTAAQPRTRLITLLRAPALEITNADPADRPMLAAAARSIGSEGLAHAGVAALTNACRLVTTRADLMLPLGLAEWQLPPDHWT